MYDKTIFANNLKKYMELTNRSRRDISRDLDISYYTVSDWVNGKKFPRMDKVERLAEYFRCYKSDLIEKPLSGEQKEKANAITDISLRMNSDEEFYVIVEKLNGLPISRLHDVAVLLDAFLKYS